MNNYYKGNLIRLSATFSNSAGTSIDPTAVFVDVTNPAGTKTTYTYGVDEEVIKDDVGDYHIDISATSGGEWLYRWYSTGTGQAAEEYAFYITDSQFD